MNRVHRKITQLHKAYRQRRDDRGSAIVIVIIAMAMIGILATTLLWMAYMNYMIKVADIRNKNSFYSAEEVVEQIMAGIQQESAAAVGVAYRDVTANWENLENEGNRYNLFATTYMDTLVENLKDPSLGSSYYDRDKLKAYIDTDVFLESSANEGVDVTAWENGNQAGATSKPARMEMVNNNSIILHDIYVSYTDSENRVSIVQTDICIDVPKLIFENGGSIDGLYEYTLIGNTGIDVAGGGGPVTAQGSVYAGTDASGKGGLLVNMGSTLTLDGSRRVISKGDIVVEGPSAGLVVRDMPGEDNRVYAKNITLKSGTLSLDSKVYVANDLALDGSGSRATLSKEYYGYGLSTYNGLLGEPAVDSAASSAIIINGKNSTLDMMGVRRLLIAGRAYIGQATTETEAQDQQAQIEAGTRLPGTPVMMGESIAVKGGQIAYLVPAECIGTRDGEAVIGQNPINGDKKNDIDEMLNGNTDGAGSGDVGGGSTQAEEDASGAAGTQGTFREVDFNKKVYRLGNKSLSEFGVTDMNHIRKVNVQYRGETLIYYYLVMDKTNAERYFVQYYDFNANKESIDRYFDKYVSGGIILGDFETPGNQYTILGNSLVGGAVTDSGVRLLTGIDQSTLSSGEQGGEAGTPEGDDTSQENQPVDPNTYVETGENADEVINTKGEADVIALSADIASIYSALTFNLTEDASLIPADPEVAKNFYVFNNIIKETQVEDYLDAHHTNEVIYETESGLRAVLTRESETSVSSVDAGGNKIRLIVSLGDVKVDKDFSGLIIAKGKITIDPSVVTSIKMNKMDLYKVLEAKNKDDETDAVTPIDMFVNGGGSMLNGAEAPDVDDAGNLVIDYSEIVRYMNWIKK